MKQSPTVAITIPTYNRESKIRTQLEALSKQPAERLAKIEVHVIDNCSTTYDPIGLASDFEALQLEIHCNVSNIGVTQNIIRCVERVESDYIVWLGDDDDIVDDYLREVFADVAFMEAHDHVVGVNHSTTLSNQSDPVTINSLSSLFDSRESFADLLFLSNWVFRRKDYLKHLFFAHRCSSGTFATIAPFLLSVRSGKSLLLSERRLFNYQPTPPEEKWSWFRFLQGAYTLFELPLGLSENEFERLRKTAINLSGVNPSFLYFSLIAQNNGGLVPVEQRWSFHKLTLLYRGLWQRQRVPIWILRLGLRAPSVRPAIRALHFLARAGMRAQVSSSFDSSL